ncbi:hypothetical protein AY606_06465 [Acinetobacter sp. SFB]|nr:hypothetical protein AY606_06465 [Acinetobacter sp. SFB]
MKHYSNLNKITYKLRSEYCGYAYDLAQSGVRKLSKIECHILFLWLKINTNLKYISIKFNTASFDAITKISV